MTLFESIPYKVPFITTFDIGSRLSVNFHDVVGAVRNLHFSVDVDHSLGIGIGIKFGLGMMGRKEKRTMMKIGLCGNLLCLKETANIEMQLTSKLCVSQQIKQNERNENN